MGMKWESNSMKQCEYKKKPPQNPVDNSIMKQSTFSVIRQCFNYSVVPEIIQYGVGLSNVSNRDTELQNNLFLSIADITITAAKVNNNY